MHSHPVIYSEDSLIAKRSVQALKVIKMCGMQFFNKWKESKDEELKEKERKKKREEERKKEKEAEEKKLKQKDSEQMFKIWSVNLG
jgi:hypothetical protein